MSDKPALLFVACRTSEPEIQRRIKLILEAAWPERPGEAAAQYVADIDEQKYADLVSILGADAVRRLLD